MSSLAESISKLIHIAVALVLVWIVLPSSLLVVTGAEPTIFCRFMCAAAKGGSGTIHSYPDELSAEYAGANGAHRMKEALAVVKIAHETQSEQQVAQLKKSFSAPKLTAQAGSATISDKQVTVSFSGEVHDDYAGLVQTSVLTAVHVFCGSTPVGSIGLQSANDGTSDFAPYAKHFTFSGSVTMPAWVGTATLVLTTDANEMGAHGRVEVPVTLSGVQPVPDLVASVVIDTGADLSPTVVDTITLTSPDVAAGGMAQTIILTETGPDTRTFTAAGDWLVSLAAPQDGIAFGSVEVHGDVRYAGDFIQNGTVFQRSDAWTPSISGPTTLVYGLAWDGAWTAGTPMYLTVPTMLGATTPVVLTGSGAADGSGSWSGIFNGNPVVVIAQALPAGSGPGSLVTTSINGNIVARLTTTDGGAAGSATASYTISDPYEVAFYRSEGVGGASVVDRSLGNAGWEPYRIRVDVPEALGDQFVMGRTWTVQGQTVAVEKTAGKWYVQDTTSGKPAVYVDPVVTPAADPRGNGANETQGGGTGTSDDPPLPEGWAAYYGEADGVRVVVYQRVGKTPPQSITMNVQFYEGTDRVENVWGVL